MSGYKAEFPKPALKDITNAGFIFSLISYNRGPNMRKTFPIIRVLEGNDI